jgi:hypothetical protein
MLTSTKARWGRSEMVSMRIRIQLFISIRIQIRIRHQGAKPMRIHADLDSSQTVKSKKLNF